MRVFIGAAALCLILGASATFAQAPASPQPATAQVSAPPVQRPFPTGTKYAFINIQRIAAESAEGKAATNKVQALNQQKVNELNEKNKALQAAQQKFEAGATVMSDQARIQLQKEIERQQVDIQRFTEDAQQDVTTLQTQLQDEFQRRLSPVVQQLASEKGLHLLFSVVDSGLVWADPALDITLEVIEKFDAAAKSSVAAPTAKPAPPTPPAAKPAAPAATPPKPAQP
jgi:outer membrane protein